MTKATLEVPTIDRHDFKNKSIDEMSHLLYKLIELVPNMPKNRRLSKLEIIQYVIDYILDLQLALEAHPTFRAARPCSTPERQPLVALSPSSNARVNLPAVHEETHNEKISSYLRDLEVGLAKPVSC
ncbi:DNA-binding protein inhibitor ID-2-like [Limulus polyphemus]|uniref:DNA-binding protein inhibitor ID-2-like n=1 Tax=Limulus polyphemus TaxID=6850 RepID=A0ABM1T9B9_LIMPO|nr:DNA-binding protein inhibitor ID-2-like [Limulus polyphemus]